MEKEKIYCCICGEEIQDGIGNNAAPIYPGKKCCSECNQRWVLPTRLAAIFGIPQPEKFKETIPANWKTMDPVDLKIYMTNKALEIYDIKKEKDNEKIKQRTIN